MRANGVPASAERPAASRPALPERFVDIAHEIRLIPGVTSALLHGKDGEVAGLGARTPVDEGALALARTGRRMGDAFALGRIVIGLAVGPERRVLLLTAKDWELTVVFRADAQPDLVQARIRSLLGPNP